MSAEAELADLILSLSREPFNLPPDVAGRLTLKQLSMLVESANRREGELLPRSGAVPSEEELFRTWGRLNKLKPYQIDRLWAERKAKGGGP